MSEVKHCTCKEGLIWNVKIGTQLSTSISYSGTYMLYWTTGIFMSVVMCEWNETGQGI